MEHIKIWMEVLLVFAGACIGWPYGRRLYASGVRVQERLSFRDIPILSGMVLFFLAVNMFFMIAADHTVSEWRALPIVVEHYERSVRWIGNLVFMGFIFATVASACHRDSRRLAGAIMIIGAVLLGMAHVSAHRTGRPVVLRESRILPDGVVLQTCGSSCAPAAGASIARKFGIMVTEADMVPLMGTTDEGTTDEQVVYGLAKINLKAVRKRFPDCDIRKVKSPAILLVNLVQAPNGHCAAFMGMQGENADIWDPSAGRQILSLDAVRERWRGWAIEVTQ